MSRSASYDGTEIGFRALGAAGGTRRRRRMPRIGVSERSRAVRAVYDAQGAFDPAVTRVAQAALAVPVPIYLGDLDIGVSAAEADQAARIFADCAVATRPAAGHFRGWTTPHGSPRRSTRSWGEAR